MKALFLTGRVVLGGFFLYNGINHLKSAKAMAPYAASKNLPYPEAAVFASGVLLALGGASVIAGVKPKFGLLGLVGFLAAASPLFHDFWNHTEPGEKQNQLIHFSKNMALLGAVLSLAGVDEPWPASIPV